MPESRATIPAPPYDSGDHRPLRIVHFIQSLDPSRGGPPQVAMHLADGQARLGHQVLVIHAGAETTVVPNGSPTAVRHQVRSSLWRRFGMTVPETKRIAQADFCHLHGIWEPLVTSAWRRCIALSVPFTVQPHGMLQPWSLAQKAFKKRLALALAYRRMLGRASFLHALNADEASDIERLGLRVPIRVIPNGVDTSAFMNAREHANTIAPDSRVLGRGHPYILFLSRLHHVKGLDLLAEAFIEVSRRHPTVQLVVAGPDDGAGDEFKAHISAAGLSGRVHMTGPLLGVHKQRALAEAEMFVLPSRQEGFSVAILEALASGTPVVVSEQCHFPELSTFDAGLVLPRTSAAFADAILEGLADPARFAARARRGLDLVRRDYDWASIASRSIAAYRWALAHTALNTAEP